MCMGHLDSGGHTGLVASVLEWPVVISGLQVLK